MFSCVVPAAASNCTIILSYNQSSEKLLFINITWDSVPVSYANELLTTLGGCMYIANHKYTYK